MLKVTYTVCYETGNDFEPTDSYNEIFYVKDNTTTTEIKARIYEEIQSLKELSQRVAGGDIWLGGWDFEEI